MIAYYGLSCLTCLLSCRQAVPVYWVFSPTYLWPEHLAARVLLVAVPLAAWMILHVATWFSMRDVLRHFR